MDRRSYLALAGAGLATAVAGCQTGEPDTGSEPASTTDSEPDVDSEDGDPTGSTDGAIPPELRVLEIQAGDRDDEGRIRLPADTDVPIRIRAILPALHGEYEIRVTAHFRQNGQRILETTETIQGVHETDHTRVGIERAETITIDTTELPDARLEMAITLEDLSLSGRLTAGTTETVIVTWPQWRLRAKDVEESIDEGLDAFRDGPDGTILDAGFDTFDWKAAVSPTRTAADQLEAVEDAVPTGADVDPGAVLDRLSLEIELVRTLAMIHSDLVGVFDDIETLRDRVDAGPVPGHLQAGIESTQEDIDRRLETVDDLYGDLTAVADTGTLQSDHYGEKIDQLEKHLSISRELLGTLTQFEQAVAQIRRARNSEGWSKQTYAERAIVRLDFFVQGVSVDSHESLDDLPRGVRPIDADDSLDPLLDGIDRMAADRKAEARDLRQAGIDEAA
jgi:hypothetical protein